MDRRMSLGASALLGAFLLVSLTLAGGAMVIIGQKSGLGVQTVPLSTAMPRVPGIRPGTRVRVQGIAVGQVTEVLPAKEPGQPVLVRFWITQEHANWVRTDSKTRLVKDGLVGERVLEIEAGSPQADPVQPGTVLASQETPDLDQLLTRLDGMVQDARAGKGTVGKLLTDDKPFEKLNDVVGRADKLLGQAEKAPWRKVVNDVSSIVSNLEQGKGTFGRLLADDDAYNQAKKMMAKANRVVGDVDENIQQVKKTWPLNGWVKDRYKILVRPELDKYRQTINSDSLFEPGTAKLTDAGKKKLDSFLWFINQFNEDEHEFVFAAFNADETDSRLADLLTQKQAEAVKDYYVNTHRVHKLGWVSWRDISAHGFGNLSDPEGRAKVTPRRIELLAFVNE